MGRVGIFSGTFDPVHAGHIGFALQAIKEVQLDKVLFLPERQPRSKHGITHYAHRVAMLRAALIAHPKLEVLELPDKRFYPRLVARLNKSYPDTELFLMMGSDVVYGLEKWPLVDALLRRCGLIVAVRKSDQVLTIRERLQALPSLPPEIHVIQSETPNVSSRDIRQALKSGLQTEGLLSSVKKYSKQHWLYVSAKAS